METTNRAGASALWIMLLTLASTVTSLGLACAAPIEALAALAALHMRRRDGIILILLTWFANQAIGFGLLHYPHTPKTFVWGIGLGTAAVASVLGAGALLPRFDRAPLAARMLIAYLAAFVAFKLVVLAWASVLGGVHTTIAPALMETQLLRNGAIFLGLYALYHVLVAIGVPAADRRPAIAR